MPNPLDSWEPGQELQVTFSELLQDAVRRATDPGKQRQFDLEQAIVLLDAFKPIVAAVGALENRLRILEAAAKQQGHAHRIDDERKDKGPPQVGG
jgi:hypothetical protein